MESKQIEQNQNEQKQRGRKSATLLLLLILLVTVTVGFAVLSTTLNIRGTSKIAGGGEWCVGPECDDTCHDAENKSCGIITCPEGEKCDIVDCNAHPDHCTCDATTEVCTPAPIDCDTTPAKCTKPNCTVTETETCACTDNSTQNCIPNPQIWMNGNTVYFDHTLEKPGDVFTFNTKYSNGGNIDAKVTNVSKSFLNTTAQKFMTYDVTYDDDSAINQNDELAAGATATYKVTVAYKSTVTVLPTPEELEAINGDGDSTTGRHGAFSSFEVNYGQK